LFDAARKFAEDVRSGKPTRSRETQQRVQAVPYFVEPNDPNLASESVEYKGGGGRIKAYLSRPKQEKEFPAVLLIHENKGLNEHIRDIARRLAEDLFAAMAYLKTYRYANARKMGVVGFCWGGGQSLYFQTKCKELGAGVVFYGSNPNSLDEVQNIACPLLGIYGELDQRITSKVPELEQALKKHGKKYSIHIYPGAQHAFNNNTNPERYHPEAAKDAWAKTIAFFKEHLGR
jgi:carboxymethylenebutenolidase